MTGVELIELAISVNWDKHHDSGISQVNHLLLKKAGELYERLVDLKIQDTVEIGAITACNISRKGKGGPVFSKCSTFTAAMILSFILWDAGLREGGTFSSAELLQLREALRAGDWREVSELFRKVWN